MNSGYNRRFGGVARLVGSTGLDRLARAHVCVVGIGGVGSWAVEALARSGLGALTLVDLDDVCISNVNRQLHALDGELGRPKVEVMARRVQTINPDCAVTPIQSFFLNSNAAEILSQPFSGVVDAIDTPSLKALLIAEGSRRGLRIITVGGAGGRRDPTAIRVDDLAKSSHDALLQEVRRRLRREHGFPRGGQLFGVECVYSTEPPVFPSPEGGVCTQKPASGDLRLDCTSGYGTASFVTAPFGMAAAGRMVRWIAESGS